ncbi:MAG: hypothetical protein ACFB2Z_02195 [Maricaulaceae bacterium]
MKLKEVLNDLAIWAFDDCKIYPFLTSEEKFILIKLFFDFTQQSDDVIATHGELCVKPRQTLLVTLIENEDAWAVLATPALSERLFLFDYGVYPNLVYGFH